MEPVTRRLAPLESGERSGSIPPLPVAEEGGMLTGGNKEYRDALQASETTIFPTWQEFGDAARRPAPLESGAKAVRSFRLKKAQR